MSPTQCWVLGYATKNGSEQKHLTPLQVKYCEVAYSVGDPTQGDNKPMKIGPRTVAKHIRLHGTRAGEETLRFSTFRVHMLLDHWYLKSWFSSRALQTVRARLKIGPEWYTMDKILSGWRCRNCGLHWSRVVWVHKGGKWVGYTACQSFPITSTRLILYFINWNILWHYEFLFEFVIIHTGIIQYRIPIVFY